MTPPNIVFILADDMGYGDIGAFGNNAARTPALDQLADAGLRWMQHYSGSAVCAAAGFCVAINAAAAPVAAPVRKLRRSTPGLGGLSMRRYPITTVAPCQFPLWPLALELASRRRQATRYARYCGGGVFQRE